VVINPSMLYLCATALTEPVLIAAMAMSLAGLSDLATRRRISSPGEVAIFCGIPAALAALSRYEGWALCLTGAIFVAAVVWRRSRSWSRLAATVAGFGGPPVLAILWWLGYNWGCLSRSAGVLQGAVLGQCPAGRDRGQWRQHEV